MEESKRKLIPEAVLTGNVTTCNPEDYARVKMEVCEKTS